jgi:hypothetical protein
MKKQGVSLGPFLLLRAGENGPATFNTLQN